MNAPTQALLCASLLLAGLSCQGEEGGGGLFGTTEVAAASLDALPQWTAVLSRLPREREAFAACDGDAKACRSINVTVWRAMMARLQSTSRASQLWEVNGYVNGLPAGEDLALYGHEEHWASPAEMLERAGDDEDRAILKYFMLRELGFAAEELRIVVATDVLRDRPQALVAARLGDINFILEPNTNTIRSEKEVYYYVPHYSLNETTRWAHISAGSGHLP